MSLYREQLESWVSKIDVKADRLIDLGGGEKPIDRRVHSWDVKEYLIADNDAQYKPDLFIDVNHPMGLALEYFNSADVVFCLEVAEYVWNPIQFHKNIFDLLKPEGVAYISYPTIYPLHNPPNIDYLRYSRHAIEKYLAEVGFETWEITPRVATNGLPHLNNFYQFEGMHPLRGSVEVYNIGYLVKAFKKGSQ